MSKPRIVPLLVFILLASFAAPSHAADTIWSAVLLARNVPKPKAPPEELAQIAPRLRSVFGYNQFEIIGTAKMDVEDEEFHSLMPTKTFWLKLKARRASVKEARGGYLLNLQLFQKDRELVDTIAVTAPDSPLFFRGPIHAHGQIIIVLQVHQDGEKSTSSEVPQGINVNQRR